MNLILVRHARPLKLSVEEGRADPSLDKEGADQALRLAAALSWLGVDALYASPLKRAIETAAPTASSTGLEVTIEEDLLELDSRMGTYAPDDMLDAESTLAKAYFSGDWSGISAESPEQFVERIRSCLDGIVERHRRQTVAVFTHGGVISAWVASVVGAERFPISWFLSDYGNMSRFQTQGSHKTRIVSLNESPLNHWA
ncbi:MAG: histidine phosphatase family protein [Acidimicrobiia bacterium]|nr:histidine phosphatase family protein [Acidimicrobiia bacterium]